jgi:hypothetical protein
MASTIGAWPNLLRKFDMDIMQSGVVEVKLTRGLVTIIDAEDFEFVSQYKWCAERGTATDYVSRSPRIRGTRKRQKLWLHRVLLNAPDGMHVDHINHNGLDNRRANLRLCTPGENSRNTRKRKGTSSEFKGVSKRKGNCPKSWEATIKTDQKLHRRTFATEIEAAHWYDEMAREHFGEFAKLNFPHIEGQR